MKRILSLLMVAIWLTAACGLHAAKPGTGASVEFEEKAHDFGTIREDDGTVTHVFGFTNTGSSPLVIISATASCGCTHPKYSPEPVKPGEKGSISVSYNPAHRPGEFDKTIKVRTNDPKHKRVNLRITGIVIPAK